MLPATPTLSPTEHDWVRTGSLPADPGKLPAWEDVSRHPLQGPLRRMPWRAPIWDSGASGSKFVPGLLRKHAAFWYEIILPDHPLRETLVSYVRDGVSVHEFLLTSHKGTSVESPYNREKFPGAVFANRIPSAHAEFVRTEMQALITRGCVVKWADVRGPEGPARPRLIQALSVEETKPRLIYDARPLNKVCRKVTFSMDTVARVALVASEGCFQGSLNDSSGFHHVLLHPASWPLFGLRYQGVDYVWTVLPFGWCESPYVYHTLSEAKVAFLRAKGIPALAYIDDSWLANVQSTHGQPERAQWLAAAEAIHVAMLVSWMCGYFLSEKKCDLRPTKVQRYLGMLCDSETASFRVPQDKMDKLHHLLRTAVEARGLSFRTLERIAGKCMSMTVAIRPASLWTHAMFTVLSRLEKSGLRHIDLSQDEFVDLRGEFTQWIGISSSSHQGPWQRAQHFTAALTGGATDASSTAWGGVVNATTGPFRAGGVFPEEWLTRHINSKEMFALYHVLLQFCTRYPDALRRAQLLVDVDNQSVVGAFRKGRAKDPVSHALLVQLFKIQVEFGFMLSLKWVPTADNSVADAISRPSRESVIRLHPHAFQELWEAMGPFNFDLMASSESAQKQPGGNARLPFFAQYDCEGASGVDVLAQDVSRLPGSEEKMFGYCFPPPIMVGIIVQHLSEWRAHAVIVVPDTRAFWFPILQQATIRSMVIAPRAAGGVFQWPSHRGGLKEWQYSKWAMRAYEVDFGRNRVRTTHQVERARIMGT